MIPIEDVQLTNPDGTKVYIDVYDHLRQALKDQLSGPDAARIDELDKPWGAYSWFKKREGEVERGGEARPEELRMELDEERERDMFGMED